jgi:hypothetical protein
MNTAIHIQEPKQLYRLRRNIAPHAPEQGEPLLEFAIPLFKGPSKEAYRQFFPRRFGVHDLTERSNPARRERLKTGHPGRAVVSISDGA